MNLIQSTIAGLALAGIAFLPATQAFAAPTKTIRDGATSVNLAPGFVGALTTLGVAPDAIAPGKLSAKKRGVIASFPITTGVVDLGTVKTEVGHAGGLSLTAGNTRGELSAFISDWDGGRPVLTGLAVVNDSLVDGGRIPLFDLDLRGARIQSEMTT